MDVCHSIPELLLVGFGNFVSDEYSFCYFSVSATDLEKNVLDLLHSVKTCSLSLILMLAHSLCLFYSILGYDVIIWQGLEPVSHCEHYYYQVTISPVADVANLGIFSVICNIF